MSRCNKCNPHISVKQKEYEKNTLSYKKWMQELEEIDKERKLLMIETVIEYAKIKSIKYSFGDKDE